MNFVSEPELGFTRNDDPEEIILRESYQVPSIAALRANIKAGIRSQILASMVGSGKTVMAAYLLHECWKKDRRGIFVVDRLNLLDQTSAVLDRYGIPHGVVQSGHARYRPGELIQVASIQTVARRGWPQADLIIADECHVVYETMTKKIAKQDARIIGLTATPFTRGLGKFYKAIVNVTTGNKLTAEGFLVPFKVWAAHEPDMAGVKVDKRGEWEEKETSKRAVKIVGDVVKEYQRNGDGRKSIIFGVDVAHCEEIQRQFLMAGINVALYTYRTEDEEREMMLREFRKPDSCIRALISVAALSRGFDVPDVGCLIMCRPIRSSFAEFIQILGRLLRAYPGKEFGIVLDLAGNFMRHYPAMVEFFEEGAQTLDDGKPKPKALPQSNINEVKKPRKCPRCKSVFSYAQSFCPSCGYIFPPRQSVTHEEGILADFDGSKVLKMDREAKIQLHGELTYICHKRGYKSGWIAHKYRAITGVWPSGVNYGMRTPSAATLAIVERMARQAPRRPVAVNAQGMTQQEIDLFA